MWLDWQETTLDILEQRLSAVPETHVKRTKSKSAFPDLESQAFDKRIAVEVKSGDQSHAWWDIARLDTVEEKRLAEFVKEYEIVIMYDQGSGSVVDVFVEEMWQTAGRRGDEVLYRPYDGKIRPKSWGMFKKGESLWASEAEFREALVRTKLKRRLTMILDWIEDLPEPMRKEIRKKLG